MFKNNNTYFIFILCLLLNLIFYENLVKAAEDRSTKTFYLNDNQSISGTLSWDNELLGPGDKLVTEFYIANDKDFSCFLKGIKIDGRLYGKDKRILTEEDIEYKNYIESASMSFYCEGKMIYSGKIQEELAFNLTGDDSIQLSENDKRKFSIEYSLDEEADKSLMGMQHKFNIDFNFSADDGAPTLVQTGSIIDMKIIFGLGALMLIVGVVILVNIKRRVHKEVS